MRQLASLIILMIVLPGLCFSQTKLTPPDKSPMDICYYPMNYPVLKIQNKVSEPLVARLMYSRPQRDGRVVYGELVEYGKIWRLGANEATEIEFFKDVTISNNKLKKGRYTMYAIPEPDKWTVIFNKETDIWGAFQYDEGKDVLRAEVKTEKQEEPAEAFTMMFEKNAVGANLIMAWDSVKAVLPINF